jgi:hypothetical protein
LVERFKSITNMKKRLIITFVALVLVGAGAFFGGMKYSQNKITQGFAQRMQAGIGNRTGIAGDRAGTGFITGDIIFKDDKSITVKLRDGGSKIIFYSDTTELSKFASGTLSDLEVGKSVSVNGKTNQDGSITAQSIQLRPEILNRPPTMNQ